MNHFSDIPLAKQLLKNIEKIRYTEPTAVQIQCYSAYFTCKYDLIVIAPIQEPENKAFAISFNTTFN